MTDIYEGAHAILHIANYIGNLELYFKIPFYCYN